MNIVKIILLSVFAFATPLVMFYQGYVIAGKEKIISHTSEQLSLAKRDSLKHAVEKQNDSLRVELKCLDTIRAIENRLRAAPAAKSSNTSKNAPVRKVNMPSADSLEKALNPEFMSLNNFIDNFSNKRHAVIPGAFDLRVDTIDLIWQNLEVSVRTPGVSKALILKDLTDLQMAMNRIQFDSTFIFTVKNLRRKIIRSPYYKTSY